MNKTFYLSLFTFSLTTTWLFSQTTKSMNLHDFMEDYVETAEKDYKKGKKEKLLQLLNFIPELAPEKDKATWKEIVDEHVKSGEVLKSCKSCHVKFKKEYKKLYRKKLLDIPEDLLK